MNSTIRNRTKDRAHFLSVMIPSGEMPRGYYIYGTEVDIFIWDIRKSAVDLQFQTKIFMFLLLYFEILVSEYILL